MALPASGQITWAMIQSEFGGTNPISINEYYRGGGLVPNVSQNGNIPTSGQISVSQFYGALAAYVDLGVDRTISAEHYSTTPHNAQAVASYNLHNTLTWSAETTTPGGNTSGTYAVGYAAADLECYATQVSLSEAGVAGATNQTGTLNSWLNLGTTRSWSQTSSATAAGQNSSGTWVLDIQIRKVGTTEVLDTIRVTITTEAAEEY